MAVGAARGRSRKSFIDRDLRQLKVFWSFYYTFPISMYNERHEIAHNV